MAERVPQTLKNHARTDPVFHFFILPVAAGTIVWMIVNAVRQPEIDSIALVLLAVAGIMAMFKIRLYALKAQDRVIRLEERMRLTAVLSEPLRARIGELNEGQLIALRFAPDAELPGLVEKTLANGWKSAEIKQAIVNWRADYFRI